MVINYSQRKTPKKDGKIPKEWLRAMNTMELIMDALDVPIVLAASNHGREEGRTKEIDAWPQAWATADRQLTNVGNTYFTGKENEDSQNGRLLTLAAPGTEVRCAPGSGNGAAVRDTGTSFGESSDQGVLPLRLLMGNIRSCPSSGRVTCILLVIGHSPLRYVGQQIGRRGS